MMEWLTLDLFGLSLAACLFCGQSILLALLFGLALFLYYGRRKGFSWRELLPTAVSGILEIRNILITFVLIGILTALWRAAGTIAVIVCCASSLIRPSVFLLMTFLLNCLVSVLTGTAFGTAATMGVICATMGSVLGVDLRLVGGAVLSGVYFGDRCSPVSTSALLISELTGTVIFDNIRGMMRSAAVPFAASLSIYLAVGILSSHSGEMMDLTSVFGKEFLLNPLCLLPAAVILVLSVLRVNVKKAMAASILTAIPLCALLQGVGFPALCRMALLGFQAADPDVGAMVNGGGVASMLRVMGIVGLSSSYSGIFEKTGLLESLKEHIVRLSNRTTPYLAMLVTSLLSGMLACNQTLTIMLTEQLCSGVKEQLCSVGKKPLPESDRCRSDTDQIPDTSQAAEAGRAAYALALEDTAVVVPPLIPWSIACAVPLSAVGAPAESAVLACYLYLLVLSRGIGSLIGKH